MLSKEDRKEIMKMLADVKKELRSEFSHESNSNYEDKASIRTDVADNTDAIIELAELLGGE